MSKVGYPLGPSYTLFVTCSLKFIGLPWAPTLVDVITAKVGPIGVMGQEVAQEGGQMVAVAQCQVGSQHMLVHKAQVEVIAE